MSALFNVQSTMSWARIVWVHSNERVKRWIRVIESMPAALISSIECMNTSEKLVFILGGLNCEYVSEWRDIYEEIVNFVNEPWIQAISSDYI